ncbi:MAG TPA: RNA polymerase sigma factor [Chthoniobacterales bacterium]|nr:RNA polymerase sigma factor [Chthoniobacterales bacterium]
MARRPHPPVFDQPAPASTEDGFPAQVDDVALVARVRAGDVAAFELIMRRHNQRLYRLARGILRNPTDAEDAVQEAYMRSFEKLGDFIGPTGFPAWLGQIVVNESLGRLRKQGRVISFEDHIAESGGRPLHRPIDGMQQARYGGDMKSQEPDPERLAASGELRRLIERAVDSLPEDFRTVFILRAVEGLSVAETGDYLGIRPETVKTRFHRARKQIQETMGNQIDFLVPSVFGFAGDRCDRIVDGVLQRLRL